MTKITNFPDFQSFYATFVKFSTDFVDWYVEKGIQGKLCCTIGFSEELIAVFSRRVFLLAKNADSYSDLFV